MSSYSFFFHRLFFWAIPKTSVSNLRSCQFLPVYIYTFYIGSIISFQLIYVQSLCLGSFFFKKKIYKDIQLFQYNLLIRQLFFHWIVFISFSLFFCSSLVLIKHLLWFYFIFSLSVSIVLLSKSNDCSGLHSIHF